MDTNDPHGAGHAPDAGRKEPRPKAFGALRGTWPIGMLVIVLIVVAVFVVLVLVRMDVLDRAWAYAALPLAIIAAAASRVITIFKAKPPETDHEG